jgi:hypothetical protein
MSVIPSAMLRASTARLCQCCGLLKASGILLIPAPDPQITALTCEIAECSAPGAQEQSGLARRRKFKFWKDHIAALAGESLAANLAAERFDAGATAHSVYRQNVRAVVLWCCAHYGILGRNRPNPLRCIWGTT